MLHQTLPILGQLWQLFEVSQILEFLRYMDTLPCFISDSFAKGNKFPDLLFASMKNEDPSKGVYF